LAYDWLTTSLAGKLLFKGVRSDV